MAAETSTLVDLKGGRQFAEKIGGLARRTNVLPELLLSSG